MRVSLIATALLLAWFGLARAEAVGLRDLEVPASERGAALRVTVWYPAATGHAVLVGDSAVFRGTPALRDAPFAAGRLPLVLVTHGGFRSAPNVANWLAAALARNDFVAAVVTPPAIPSGPATLSVLGELWLRPADLSATITALARAPEFAARIDMASVAGVGFHLGGYAVLGLAGARLDPLAFARSCQGPRQAFDCAWFAKGGVDLQRVDAARLARSNLDPRLKVAVAVDPELTEALANPSLGTISVPVHIIGLGPPQATRPGLDATPLAARIPGADHATIEDAGRFSSFAECKPEGPAILKREGDGPLCDDGGARSRAAIHEQLATIIVTALRKSLRWRPAD